MKKTNNSGFSLVELIIVIAIMAVLIGVLAPQFIKFVEKSRESTDLQNVEEVKTAVETYVADKGDSLSGVATITVELTNAPTGVIKPSVDLKEYGVATDGIKTKSAKWEGSTTWTYHITTAGKAYTWENATGHATYFKADGSDNS